MASKLLTRIRIVLAFFIVGLVLSGITAFPLETELKILAGSKMIAAFPGLSEWIIRVRDGLVATYASYPFIAYGTDWLAFAHIVIAITFIGPFREPVKNIWVIDFGIIACILVIPLALIAGGFRGIPFGWRLIDCSFGVFGVISLLYCRAQIKKLAACPKQLDTENRPCQHV